MSFEMEDNERFQFTELDRERITCMEDGDTYTGECGHFRVLKYPFEYILIVENVYKDGFKKAFGVILYLSEYSTRN